METTQQYRLCSVRGGSFIADCFFNFTISQRTPLLQQPLYSDYQYFLYETISELRDKGLTFNQIAEELNRKGYLSARGKVFKGNHVHSIVKKKRIRDEKLKRKHPEEWSEISFEVVDKSFVSFFWKCLGNKSLLNQK